MRTRKEFCSTHHFVNGNHNLQHLIVADLSISVDIIELEGPIQLIIHLAPRCHAQGANEFLEIDGTTFVLVENVEDIFGEG